MVQRGEDSGFTLEPGQAFRIIGEDVREDFEGHIPAELGVPGAVDFTHPSRADQGGHFIRAEAGAGAEGHVGYGNGGAILPPVGLSGTHNGRAGFAGSGAASDWLSQAHVRILSDDPVDLKGTTAAGRLGATYVSDKSGRNEVYGHPSPGPASLTPGR